MTPLIDGTRLWQRLMALAAIGATPDGGVDRQALTDGEILAWRLVIGWAMEARLYAEDPITGFLPSTGRLDLLDLHEGVLRVETGVEQGDTVTPFYDPMIAKLVASGEDRDDAMLTLATGLFALRVWPVKTNAAFLLTQHIGRHPSSLPHLIARWCHMPARPGRGGSGTRIILR